jgi:tRNA A-37 threonylcarbamoyl transferase component Bud32
VAAGVDREGGVSDLSGLHNPFDPEASQAIARAQIRRQANDALIKGAGFVGWMGVAGSLQTAGLTALGKPGFVLPMAFAVWGAVTSFGIRGLARRGRMVGAVKYVACAVAVSMPTCFLLAAHLVMPAGAATYVNGPMPLLYFMLLAMTGFLFDPRLTLVCGAVAALGFLVAAQLALPELQHLSHPDFVTRQDLVDAPIYWIKSFMIAFSGLVVSGLSTVARRIVLSTVDKAYERGRYRLVERIGQGGMGEVWIAEHDMLARRAAVKLIRSEELADGAGQRALERFEREAQATSALRSPHTIEVFDFGLADDGTFYYVMELLDGLDLDTLVRRHGPVPAERAVHLLVQVCASLEEAHAAGLVHRDVKPANVFVCRYGVELDFVKVLDFGLVTPRASGAAELPTIDGLPQLTDGQAVGTPAFIPPEVIGGVIDARSDLYAVGCVAYWLLTGSLVFEAASSTEMVLAHVRESPTPVSLRSELEVPAELEAVIMACLAKRPGDRPASAAELARRLRAVPLAGDWSSSRRAEWWRLHAPPRAELAPRATPTA